MNNKITVKDRTSKVCGWVGDQRQGIWITFCLILWLTVSFSLTASHTFTNKQVNFTTEAHEIITIDALPGQSYTLTATDNAPFIFSDADNENIFFSVIDANSLKYKNFTSTTQLNKAIRLTQRFQDDSEVTLSIKSDQPIRVIFSTKSDEKIVIYLLTFLMTLCLCMFGIIIHDGCGW